MFKMKREKCGLCGGKLGDKSGIMQYRATNGEGIHEMFSMAVCQACCDDMDANQSKELEPAEVRDWIMRK